MRYEPRRDKAWQLELEAQPEMRAAMTARAAVLADAVRQAALPYRNTGYFIRHVRARGNRVLLTDPFWHLAEFGSVHNPPQRNVLRAARSVGLRFDDPRNPG